MFSSIKYDARSATRLYGVLSAPRWFLGNPVFLVWERWRAFSRLLFEVWMISSWTLPGSQCQMFGTWTAGTTGWSTTFCTTRATTSCPPRASWSSWGEWMKLTCPPSTSHHILLCYHRCFNGDVIGLYSVWINWFNRVCLLAKYLRLKYLIKLSGFNY